MITFNKITNNALYTDHIMHITADLQYKFNTSFARIMKGVPQDLQKKWSGIIEWKDDRSYPEISPDVIKELPPAAKAAYITLLNKLSRGII